MPYRQGKGKIDYLNFTVSPIKGLCPNITNQAPCADYCYMARFFNRLRNSKNAIYETIRRDSQELYWLPRTPSIIGVCFNLDMFHPDIGHDEWVQDQLDFAGSHPEHTWIYLTKRPERYADFDIPKNAWYGTTFDGLPHTQDNIVKLLSAVALTHNTWVSFEPMLRKIEPNYLTAHHFTGDITNLYKPGWIVIGQDTSPGAKQIPKMWVDLIVNEAKKYKIPVWMKDSLSFMDYMIKEKPEAICKRYPATRPEHEELEITVLREPRTPELWKNL